MIIKNKNNNLPYKLIQKTMKMIIKNSTHMN